MPALPDLPGQDRALLCARWDLAGRRRVGLRLRVRRMPWLLLRDCGFGLASFTSASDASPKPPRRRWRLGCTRGGGALRPRVTAQSDAAGHPSSAGTSGRAPTLLSDSTAIKISRAGVEKDRQARSVLVDGA